MIDNIDSYVKAQSIWFFCCAPGSARESLNIVSEHCASVIECEQRIPAPALELALTDDASSSALGGPVLVVGKMLLHVDCVMGILVGHKYAIFSDKWFERLKQPSPRCRAIVFSKAVFFSRLLCKQTLCGHRADFKAKNTSLVFLDGKSDREGFALGMLKSLHVVELEKLNLGRSLVEDKNSFQSQLSKKQKLSNNRFAVHPKIERTSSLRKAPTKKRNDRSIYMSFVLPKLTTKSCV